MQTAGSGEAGSAAGVARLAPNTAWNVAGWAVSAAISFVSVPLLVRALGLEGYGLLGIGFIVAGYAASLTGPIAQASIRFLAESAGAGWPSAAGARLRVSMLATLAVAAAASTALLLLAPWMAQQLFGLVGAQAAAATAVFRVGAVTFLASSLLGTLLARPAAQHRYDEINLIRLATVLLGATVTVGTALCTGSPAWVATAECGCSLVVLLLVSRRYLENPDARPLSREPGYTDQLLRFAGFLLAGQVISILGLQLDRTLVGAALGPGPLAEYLIPSRVTDQLVMFEGAFATALYPLSATLQSTDHLARLRVIYGEIRRVLLVVVGLPTTFLVIYAAPFLRLWIGPEAAAGAAPILQAFAIAALLRAPAAIAFQVNNGLGHVRFNLLFSILFILAVAIPLPHALRSGLLPTVAWSVTASVAVQCTLYDCMTQVRYLGVPAGLRLLGPHAHTAMLCAATAWITRFVVPEPATWGGLLAAGAGMACLYTAAAWATRALTGTDLRAILRVMRGQTPVAS